MTMEVRGRIKRWAVGELRALAIAADGVTKRRISAAVRERACIPNWRAGWPCRNSPEDQNNEKNGMRNAAGGYRPGAVISAVFPRWHRRVVLARWGWGTPARNLGALAH